MLWISKVNQICEIFAVGIWHFGRNQLLILDDATFNLKKESEKFCTLIDNAFAPNFRDAFLHSVLLAKALGVNEKEILFTTEDIDSFFLD